jgi:ubiquinone/menaquinone biosynthesis C-methylase UbiE
LNAGESRYVEKPGGLSRLAHSRQLAAREAESGGEAGWLRGVKDDLPKFIPCLTRKCGLEFRGRILEIGAGAAWFSAELSKLPTVVEITATGSSPKLLKEEAPKVFRLLGAHAAKITRMPADFYKLDFPDNYFDFVVCSAVLHHAASVLQLLCEAKRVLKPGGQFVAIREPVWPLIKVKPLRKAWTNRSAAAPNERFYTLAEYRRFFAHAGLELAVKRVNLSRGFKYYFDEMVNGLTHARYAFVATKKGRG